MKLNIIGGGGNTIDFDELTADPENVTEGMQFLGVGSDDVQTGKLPNKENRGTGPGVSEERPNVPVHAADDVFTGIDTAGVRQIALSPERGKYPGNGKAYVGVTTDSLGIVPDAIRNNTEIAGVKGSYGADATISESDIKEGKIGYGKNGRIIGNRKDYGTVNIVLSAGEKYEIGEGMYDDGKVEARSLASQTAPPKGQSPATAEKMVSGTSAVSNGVTLYGKMIDRGSGALAPGGVGAGGSGANEYYAIQNIPEGWYHKSDASWSPEIRILKSKLRDYLGVSENKIILGQSIAGVNGVKKELKFRYGTVMSSSSSEIDDGDGDWFYACRFNTDIIPEMGALIYYTNGNRDITFITHQRGAAIYADIVNWNQTKRFGLNSAGWNHGEYGARCFDKNLVIPVAYRNASYGYWLIGY